MMRFYDINKILLFLVFVSCQTSVYAQQDAVKTETMVRNFYAIYHKPLYWFSSDINRKWATDWLTMIEMADDFGIVLGKSQSDQIHVALLSNSKIDNIYKEQRDRVITGLVLNFIKNLQEGDVRLDYDEISISRDSVYINQLLNSNPRESVSQIVSRLDCKDHDYLVLKRYLNDSITASDTLKYKYVIHAINYRKYLAANHSQEYIVANIPATEVSYYRNDSLRFKMRTVVGKRTSPTPTIASYITNIVTFPRWHVPHSIAVKELLPMVQKNENYLEQNSLEVVDWKGRVIEDAELKWKSYNRNNFPYYFRQASGPRNSLGVLKFNLQSPFSIFLHSTNLQSAFARDFRFLSHGCIRLEKPFDLAMALLPPDKIDVKALKSGKKDTESKTIILPRKIPVFIIYVPVTVDGGKVIFLKDEYGLIK